MVQAREHSPEGNLIKGTEVRLPKGLCYLVSYIILYKYVYDIYRVVFLTGPPDFQFQMKKT